MFNNNNNNIINNINNFVAQFNVPYCPPASRAAYPYRSPNAEDCYRRILHRMFMDPRLGGYKRIKK